MSANLLDKEARLSSSDHRALRLWLRLLSCTHLIESRVRNRLRDEFETTLPRFDLMAQLERRPEGLRMTELSQQMMVTGANITSLTDSLESQGWVVRAEDEHDRRVYRVQLTSRGREEFARMAEAHEAWIVEALGGLGARQIDAMHRELGRLKQQLQTKESA
jgi:DNA-binding MarR family transcriptional regulator